MTWSPFRRRLALAGGAVVLALLVLLLVVTRLGRDDGGGEPTQPSLPVPTSVASPATSAPVRLRDPAGVVEGDLSGGRVRLEVGPLVRSGTLTVLTALLTVIEAPEGGTMTIGDKFTARGERSGASFDLSDVRLFAPEQGLLASPGVSPNGKTASSALGNETGMKAGEAAGLRIAFGSLSPEARRADVLWPLLGVIPYVPVEEGEVPPLPAFDGGPPRDVDLVGVVGQARPVTARSAELEGAVRTDRAPDRTTVVLASDVLFALDSADLSPQANVALDRAAAQIEAAGPGPVKVTGHTDDQGSDQYNLDLSNRRARAAASALAGRLAPDRYPLEVSGRGEAEPAVKGTTPEARAANRRVELLVERRQRSEPAPASSALPPGGGPAATAVQGLVFDRADGSRLRLRAERAVRDGSWLRVDLTAAIERLAGSGGTGFLLDLRDVQRGTLRADASGVGVIDGPVLRLPAVDPDGICACDNTLGGLPTVGLEQRRLSVWVGVPSKLGATVVVQLPKGQGRLLEVPVTTR